MLIFRNNPAEYPHQLGYNHRAEFAPGEMVKHEDKSNPALHEQDLRTANLKLGPNQTCWR